MATRIVYQQELSELDQQIMHMSEALGNSIDATVEALQNMDADKARNIMKEDDVIDTIERSIEKTCIELIAKQAPIATDLRKICSYMRMIADIERIADHCSDISEYIIMLSSEEKITMPEGVLDMFDAMRTMASQVIQSFVESNFDLAGRVIKGDDVVDAYFEKIKTELCIAMKNQPDRISAYVDYLMIIKYVERMADHCTNLAHWVQFIISGQLEL